MENPIFGQLEQAAAALLTGGGLGLLYDVFRAPRRRLGLAAVWDTLFWACALAALFMLAQAGLDGVRLYSLLAAALGGGLYLGILSPLVLPGLDFLCGILERFLRFVLKELKKGGNKLAVIFKKGFPKTKKWYKMKERKKASPENGRRRPGRKGRIHEAEEKRHTD